MFGFNKDLFDNNESNINVSYLAFSKLQSLTN
jgi:hypothetical protein